MPEPMKSPAPHVPLTTDAAHRISLSAPDAAATGLLTLICLVPVLADRTAFFDTTIAMKSLVGLLEGAFVVLVINQRQAPIPNWRMIPRSLLWIGGAWLAWSTLSVILAGHPINAVVRHGEWLLHGLFAVSLWTYFQLSAEMGRRLSIAAVAGFFAYLGLFTLAWFATPDPTEARWIGSMPGFAHIRHFGYYASACLILACWPWATKREAGSTGLRVFCTLALVACWTLLFWAGGRGPFFALFTSIGLLAVVGLIPNPRKLLITLVTTAVIGFYLSDVFATSSLGADRLIQTAANSESMDQYSSGRLTLWQDALALIASRPWFGLGPDGYLLETSPRWAGTVQPHSFLIQAVVSWGFVGGALAVALLLTAAVLMGWKLRTQRSEDPYGGHFIGFWLALMLGIFSVVDGTLYHALPMAFTAIGLALAIPAPKSVARASRTRGDRRRWNVIAAICLTPILIHTLSLWAAWTAEPPLRDSWRTQVVWMFPSALSDPFRANIVSRWSCTWEEHEREIWQQTLAPHLRTISVNVGERGCLDQNP